MSISYNPGVTDRRGELLGAGIREAGASIADAIDNIKQQHDKLKATKAMVDAWGGDSSTMNQQQAQAFLLQKTVVEPARAALEKNRAEQESNKQLGSYLQSAAGAAGAALPNTGPVKDDLMATLMQGRGPQANMVQSPSPDALKVQLLNAVKANPNAFLTPEGQKLLTGFLQQAAARQQGSVTKDPNSGLFMGRNGEPLAAGLQNLLLGNAGGKAAAADFTPSAGVQSVTLDDGTKVQIPYFKNSRNSAMPIESEIPNNPRYNRTADPNKGLLPPGTKTVVENGITYAQTPDGWRKPMGRAATAGAKASGKSFQDIWEEIMEKMSGGGTNAPDGASGGAPKAGDVQEGYKFKGGKPGDPNNWEPVNE